MKLAPTSATRTFGFTAAAAGLAAGAVIGSAGSAAAAIGTGRVQLCSLGNYASFLDFEWPDATGESPAPVPQGSCVTYDVPAAPDEGTTTDPSYEVTH